MKPKVNEPIENDLAILMNDIVRMMDRYLNGEDKEQKKLGITLLIYDFGNKGKMNYISTGNREDMICSMKETIALLEGRAMEESRGH